ncbi:hypothetical protein K7G98_15250 [Saccharothrix sp. MB29]|nr:hypothetical protein [Saccharothrix sp. MB29]
MPAEDRASRAMAAPLAAQDSAARLEARVICWDRVGTSWSSGCSRGRDRAAPGVRDAVEAPGRAAVGLPRTRRAARCAGGPALPASVVEDERLLAVLRHHVGADADDHELVWRGPSACEPWSTAWDVVLATLPPRAAWWWCSTTSPRLGRA